jgi:non-ribosomal peptide synthetase component E (peptide arylation enzyme)
MAKPTRYTAQMVEDYMQKGYWQPVTYSGCWERNARDYPDREAIVDSKTRVTWSQAKQWTDRMALGLLEMGVKRDEAIVIQLPNYVELILLRVACEKAGVLHVPVMRTLRHREMEYILKYVEAVGAVIPGKYRDFDYFQMIREVQPNLPRLKHIIVLGDEVPEGAVALRDMLKQPLEERYPADYLQKTSYGPTEVSFIVPTSGTTGLPKLAEYQAHGLPTGGKGVSEMLSLTSQDALAAFLPVAGGTNVIAYFGAPWAAAKIVMLEAFNAEDALKLIKKEKVTVACVVPAQLTMMLRHPSLKDYDLSSLRLWITGGAHLPYQLAVEAEEKTGGKVLNFYGAEDWGGVSATRPEDPRQVRLGTVGRTLAGSEIKLVDNAGQEVPPGEVGEIWGRGPTCSTGYYKDPEATWKAWSQDGWFRMGDLGKFDEQGNLVVVGREKEMIIRGGQNIFPIEIEKMLMAHPAISDVALVGMPDPVMGERACAFVALKPGGELSFEQMVSFLREQKIAPYKLPERLEVVEKLPMIGAQKVDKRALSDDIMRKLKAEGKV